MVYSRLRYALTLEISKLCAQRSDGRRWHVCRDGGTPPGSPRRQYVFHPDEVAEAEAQGLLYVIVPQGFEHPGMDGAVWEQQPAAEASLKTARRRGESRLLITVSAGARSPLTPCLPGPKTEAGKFS